MGGVSDLSYALLETKNNDRVTFALNLIDYFFIIQKNQCLVHKIAFFDGHVVICIVRKMKDIFESYENRTLTLNNFPSIQKKIKLVKI